MSDGTGEGGRARPQYGEYATPDEVAAARGITVEELAAEKAALATPPRETAEPVASAADAADAAGAAGAIDAPAPHASTVQHGAPPPVATAPRPAPRWDVPLTVGLLVLAVLNLANSIPGYLQMEQTVRTSFEILGVGDVEPGAGASTAGIVLIVAETLLIVASILLALVRIRARRRAFWVPLAGLGVYLVVGTVIVTVLLGPALAALGQNPS